MSNELNELETYYNFKNESKTTQLPAGMSLYTTGEQAATSFSRGVDDSLLVGLLPEVIGMATATSNDKKSGLKPLTPDEFKDQGYDYFGDAFEYKIGETPSATQLRFNRFTRQQTDQTVTSNNTGVMQPLLNFGSEFVGGMAGDLPIAFVPYANVANATAKAANAMKVGWRTASRQALRNQTKRQAAYVDAFESGSKWKIGKFVAKDYFKEATIAASIESPLWGAAASYVGDDVGFGDVLVNGAFSVGASVPFSGFSIRSAFKKQAEYVKFNNDVDQVNEFMESGEVAQAAFKLAEFYEPAQKLAQENKEFAFILEGVDDVNSLTPEQIDAARRFNSAITIEELKKGVANLLLQKAATVGEKASALENADEIKNTTERIYTAMDRNEMHLLSDDDYELLLESGWTPSDGHTRARLAYSNLRDQFRGATYEPSDGDFQSGRGDYLLTDNARAAAQRSISEYDGPQMFVVEDTTIDTIALVNPKTGKVTINPAKLQEDWDAGMPYLLGLSEGDGSAQKKLVFADIDLDKFREALGSVERYREFILYHEAGHVALKHKGTKRSEWMSQEALNNEKAANEFAAMSMGIDWRTMRKTLDIPVQGELNLDTPTTVTYKAGVRAVNAAVAAGEGVSVLRKAGEEHYGNPFSHLANARDAVKTSNLQETVDAYRAWLEGTDHTDVKQERRQWVLDQIDSGALDGKVLLYYSKQQPNHAEVLAEFISERRASADADPLPDTFNPQLTQEAFDELKIKLGETILNPQTKQSNSSTPKLSEEATTQLERNTLDFNSLQNNRLKFFDDNIRTLLGNPEALDAILSTPEGYNAVADSQRVARKAHVKEKLEELGLEDYEFIANQIIDIQGNTDFRLAAVNKFFDRYSIYETDTQIFDYKGIPDDLKTSVYIILGENPDNLLKARAEVIQSINEANSAGILSLVHNEATYKRYRQGIDQFDTVKQKVEWIQTQLDGQQRSGFNPQASAQVKSRAQVILDSKPINDVLEKHGLWDVFIGAGHGPYLEVLRRQTGGNPDAVRIYGENLRENINEFAADLMSAIRTGTTPDKWKGVEAFEELVSVINQVRNSQIAALNRMGSNVRVRSDFSGWSQRWSDDAIKRVGIEAWKKDMRTSVDWEATEKAHGGLLLRRDGKQVKFTREQYLDEWYHQIVEQKQKTDGADIAKSFEQSRTLILKADSEAAMLAKYSGEANLGKLLMDQIRYRSEMISNLNFLGNDPAKLMQDLLNDAGAIRGDNIGRLKYDTVLGTTKLLTNDLDNPVDATFATIMKKVRAVGNLAFLPLSGFSALMDIPLVSATLKYTGAGDATIAELMPLYQAALKRQFKGDPEGLSKYLKDAGAGFDLMNNANLRGITGDTSGSQGFLSLAMSFMFEANGMTRFTAAHQELFVDWTARNLAEEANAGAFSAIRIESLKNFGFTDAEIDVLLKSVSDEAPDGIARIMPQTIENVEASNKLREYMIHYIKQSAFEPDVGAQAISRGNLKSGTIGGESMRTGFQYLPSILGLSRVIFNRWSQGYKGDQLNQVRAMSHLVAFIGTSLAAAWMVLTLKDISKGRLPMNPLELSSFDMKRIINQSGLLGVGELGFGVLEGQLPLGPLASTPFNLAGGVFSGDPEKVGRSLAPYAGGNMPVVGPAIRGMIGLAFTQSITDFMSAENDYIQRY